MVAAGCSASSSPSSPSASAAPETSASVRAGVCTSLTAAVNVAAHASWKPPTETDNGTLHNCAFGPSDPGVLTVQIADGESRAGFVDNRALVASAGAVASVSGVGDEAYTQSLNGATLVATRQGDVGVVVQLQDGTKDDAVAIARAALTVLGK